MIIISIITKLVVHEFFSSFYEAQASISTDLVNIIEEHLTHLVDRHCCINWTGESLKSRWLISFVVEFIRGLLCFLIKNVAVLRDPRPNGAKGHS